jgi:hypothetical protein
MTHMLVTDENITYERLTGFRILSAVAYAIVKKFTRNARTGRMMYGLTVNDTAPLMDFC